MKTSLRVAAWFMLLAGFAAPPRAHGQGQGQLADQGPARPQVAGTKRPSDGWGPERNGLCTRLLPAQKEYVGGRPAKFRLEMKNVGEQERTYDSQQVGVNGSMRISDPEGKAVPYVGGSFQTFGRERSISPGETVVLIDELDLSDQYLFVQPGSYAIEFRGSDLHSRADSAIPPSKEITVAFRPGVLPASVQVPARLVGVLPEGWDVSLNGRVSELDGDKIAPPGWASARGTYVGLVAQFGPSKRDRLRVDVWAADDKLTWTGKTRTGEPTKPGEAATYLGKGADGHVYLKVPAKAETRWPDLQAKISAALHIGADNSAETGRSLKE